MDHKIHFYDVHDGDDAKHCNASTNNHSYANMAYSNINADDTPSSCMDNNNMMANDAKCHITHDTSKSHMLHILVQDILL